MKAKITYFLLTVLYCGIAYSFTPDTLRPAESELSRIDPPIVSVNQPSCTVPGGTITVSYPVGSDFSYSINGATYQRSPVFEDLEANTYFVTVRSGEGRTSTSSIAIVERAPAVPAPPIVEATHPTCPQPTGTLLVTSPIGSGLLYSVDGVNYQSANRFSYLTGGESYNVTVKNSSGCVSGSTRIYINETPPPPAIPTIHETQPNCISSTGTLTVTSPVGPDYTYSINNEPYQTSPVFAGLIPNNYTIRAKRGSDCFSPEASIIMYKGPHIPPKPIVTIIHPSCSSAEGSITITKPIGNSLLYSINGIDWQPSVNFHHLPPGSYTVSVTNMEGGCTSSTVAVVSGAPAICHAAGIFHTSVSCQNYLNEEHNDRIPQLCYSSRLSRVANVTPGQFFYYTLVTAPTSSFAVDIIQSKSNSEFAFFRIQQSNQVALYNIECQRIATGVMTTVGNGRIQISGTTAGTTYLLSVKYDSKSVIGSAFSGPAPTVQYFFESSIDGSTLPDSAATINLVPDCNSRTQEFSSSDFQVSLAPNPSSDNFTLFIPSLSTEIFTIKVHDLNGRFISEFQSEYKESVSLGSELSPGLYFIEVTQGDLKKVLRALKL